MPDFLDVGRADEYPQKARNECEPKSDRRARYSTGKRRQSRKAGAAEKTDKQKNEDKWPRCRLGKSETRQHFIGL